MSPAAQTEQAEQSTGRRYDRRRIVGVVVANDMRRLGRDRLALFFVVVLPFLLIAAIGSFLPPDEVDVVLAVVDSDRSTAADEFLSALGRSEGIQLETGYNRREAERDVRIQTVSAALVVPDGFGESTEPGAATVEYVVDPTAASATLVRAALEEAIGEQSLVRTVERELAAAGAEDPFGASERAVASLERSEVEVTLVGVESRGSTHAFVATGQMILFMFVNSLTAGAGFIEMRRLGILGRARAGPVDGGDILLGLGLSRFIIATALAGAITVLAALIYGVSWGSPAVMVAVIGLFGLVSAGASTLIGSLYDEPDAAVSVGIPVGLGMAALGGCMFPLFLAPEAMQVAAKIFTPHAWAVEAIMGSASDGDSLADVWVNLVVLAAWAAGLLTMARVMARRRVRQS